MADEGAADAVIGATDLSAGAPGYKKLSLIINYCCRIDG